MVHLTSVSAPSNAETQLSSLGFNGAVNGGPWQDRVSLQHSYII